MTARFKISTNPFLTLFVFLSLISINQSLIAQTIPAYVPTNGLKAYYQFNGNAKDISGNNNNGTVNGAQLTTDRFGLNNCAYFFNGASSITAPTSNSLTNEITNSFSICAWIKMTSFFNGINSSFSPIVHKKSLAGAIEHQYDLFIKQQYVCMWGPNIRGYAPKTIPLDTWFFVVATFNNGVIKYYMNGTLFYTQTMPVTSLQPADTENLEIGADIPGDKEYLNGSLDDIGIWNRALTQAEITGLYNSCINNDNIFPKDTIQSCSKNYLLDAGLGYSNYSWNAESNNQTINVNQTGWYSVTVYRGNCSVKDSVYVSIVNANIENNDTAICLGESISLSVDTNAVKSNSYEWSNGNYNSSNTISPTSSQLYFLTATNGITTCSDSVKITVNIPTHNSIEIVSCDSFIWNGTNFTTSGTYLYQYNNENGCVSTDTLHLTINKGTHHSASITACESYLWNGAIYTTSGTYLYQYNNENGCASTDTLYLTINQGTYHSASNTACESYLWNGSLYSTSGTYLYEYNNENGCTSTDTLYLTINKGTHHSASITACESYLWNGNIYSISGIYLYQYNNENGCTSIDTLYLTINKKPLPPTINITQPNRSNFYGKISISVPVLNNLQFSLDELNFQSNNYFNNLAPGVYKLTVRNDAGCSVSITNILINPAIPAGIYNGNASCNNFKNNNEDDDDDDHHDGDYKIKKLYFNTSRGKITNVSPGVFTYYTLVTAKSSSFAIEIKQNKSNNNFTLFALQQDNQVKLWDLNCNNIATGNSISVGQGRILINNAIVGKTYILSVKYDARSIVGTNYSGNATECIYSFESRINNEIIPGSMTNIRLTTNCNGNSRVNQQSINEHTESLNAIAYPNPSPNNFKITTNSTSSEPITIRIVDIFGRIVIDNIKTVTGKPIQLGDQLPKGLYFIEIIQHQLKKTIKVEKL